MGSCIIGKSYFVQFEFIIIKPIFVFVVHGLS